MLGLNRLFGNREIDAWRDDFSLLTAAVLNQAAAGLVVALDAEVGKAGWIDSLIGQSAFIATRVAPLVRTEIDPIAADIMANANAALAVSRTARLPSHSSKPSHRHLRQIGGREWLEAARNETDAPFVFMAAD